MLECSALMKGDKMKNQRMIPSLTILILALLACQTASSSGGTSPTDVSVEQVGDSSSSASGFPLTADAFNVIDIGDGSVLFYTKFSLDDVMGFYRTTYVSQGYTERALLTVVSDGTFSMVFDGDPSGKAVVIQSVDLGDGSRTVSIRFDDV